MPALFAPLDSQHHTMLVITWPRLTKIAFGTARCLRETIERAVTQGELIPSVPIARIAKFVV